MGNTPSSDSYPTLTYIDSLLYPNYVTTDDPYYIGQQVRNDWLLNTYVDKLNLEIIDDIEEFREQSQLVSKIFWATRTHGWCGVTFYKNSVRVFSSPDWTEWIKELDETTNKQVRVGFSVAWNDDLGNNWTDNLYFDERQNENEEIVEKTYLFLWSEGDGRILDQAPALSAFAIPDINTAVLTIDIQARQILHAISFGATNPFFYFLKYGNAITPTERINLVTQMSYVNSSKAIGAKTSILEGIDEIENQGVEKATLAFDKFIMLFSSITRLPLSYYLGEKQTGGLGDTGESTDELKVMKKKEFILQHFIGGLTEIFKEQFSIILPDLYNFYKNKAADTLKESQELQNKDENKDEERTERTDQEAQTERRSDNEDH